MFEHPYQPEQWRLSETYTNVQKKSLFTQPHQIRQNPNPREQSRLLELLGLINYQILTGNRVYIEVDGVVYKTLFGAYWRSVFTGIEHYLLKCEAIPLSLWAEDDGDMPVFDLPIAYADGGWTAGGYSLSLMVFRA